jgi:hypothetical protein
MRPRRPGTTARIGQVAGNATRLDQGTLHPALVRLEQKDWTRGACRATEKNREASAVTRSKTRALAGHADWRHRPADLMNRLPADRA